MLHNSQPYEVICPFDPAIDFAQTDLQTYTVKRDLSLLRFRPGAEPARFYLRPITRAVAISYLLAEPDYSRRQLRAFRASVIEVRGARLEDGSGRTHIEPTHWRNATAQQREQLIETVTMDEVELFDVTTLLDVGEVALTRAFLPRGIEVIYQPPPTSVRLLVTITALLAVQSKSTSPPTSNAPSEDETTTGGLPCDEPGAATATVLPTNSPDEP